MNNIDHNDEKNAFESSVEQFSHKDTTLDVNTEKRAMIPSLLIQSLMIAVCICLFGYATIMLASNSIETEEVNELYESVRTEYNASAIKPSTPLLEPTSMYTFQQMLDSDGEYKNYVGDVESIEDLERQSSYYRNYVNFKSKYPDAYGWIYVNYTQIDYPIMKGDNTNYYLTHNFKGAESDSGCITAESNLSDTYSNNRNAVIYGHCMKNGTMFRTLKTFLESANRNTLAKTMRIEIYTDEGIYIYELLAGYRDDSNIYARTFFAGDDDFTSFIDKVKAKNTLSVYPKYNASSKLCTLITCANVTNNEDERYILHGILKSFIPASQL